MGNKFNKIDSRLDENSYLLFEYLNGDGTIQKRIKIPFFQNPRISESKKATYVDYNILSRSSPLYSYIGAKARMFNLEFLITLPHVVDFALPKVIAPADASPLTGEAAKASFFNPDILVSETKVPGGAEKYHNNFIEANEDLLGASIAAAVSLGALGIPAASTGIEDKINSAPKKMSKYERAIDLINFWLHVVRSSTHNNSNRPTIGPPIVRLNHGVVYQNIPCVVMDYKITIEDERAGMDQRSLMPRVVSVSMGLAEHRAGDFGNTGVRINDLKDPNKRDNLVGWEAVIDSPHSIDPIRVL